MTPKTYTSSSDDPRVTSVMSAISNLDITESAAWSSLDALSAQTTVDDVEVDPAGIIFDGRGGFFGAMNVYVVLRYGSGDESLESAESFRGSFNGKLHVDGTAEIDDVKVDVSPFFEGEEA